MSTAIDFNLSLSPTAQQAIAWLQAQRVQAWLVGGSVRDLLLQRPVHDLDLAVPGNGLRLAQRLADALGVPFFPLDAARDVGRVVLFEPDGSQTFVDVAVLRGPSLADDLRLRDFTFNALALDLNALAAGVIDVTGGLEDLWRRLLRVASGRAFQDDPLRILRGVRQSLAFDLVWDSTSLALARRSVLAIRQVAAERVREELNRAFVYSKADLALAQLDDLGALAVVLPEIKALQGVTQNPPHSLDVYAHTLAVVRWTQALLRWRDVGPAAAPELQQIAALLAPFDSALNAYLAVTVDQGHSRAGLLVWTALLHDIGKPATRRVDAAGAITFSGHEAMSGRFAALVLKRLAFSSEANQIIARACTEHRRAGALAASTAGQPDRRQVYHYFQAAHPVGVEVALLSLADHLGAWGTALRAERWQARLALVQTLLTAFFQHHAEQVRPQPLLDGRRLMAELNLKPGPQIGELLALLRAEQAAGVIATEAAAWDFVRAAAARLPNA